MVAVMAQIVTMFRRRPGTDADGWPDVVIALVVVLVGHRRRQAEQGRQRPAMVAYIDVFHVMMIASTIALPVILLLQKPTGEPSNEQPIVID